MTGTTVTPHLHWRKRNQHVMNQRLSTSTSGKLVTENLVEAQRVMSCFCFFFFFFFTNLRVHMLTQL